MQTVIVYSAKASVTATLKQALLQYKNDNQGRLVVLCTTSEIKEAQEWIVELQQKYSDVLIYHYAAPTCLGDKDIERLYQRFYPRLRQFPVEGESIYLHPLQVPAEDHWDTKLRDALRLTTKPIYGQGTKDADGAYVFNGSFIYTKQFQEYSRSGRMYFPNGNIFKSIGWEVKQMGEVVDALPMLQKASDFRLKTGSPMAKVEVKTPEQSQKAEDAVGDAFAALSASEAKEEEKVTDEPKPVKKKAAKKASRKRAAKKAAPKKEEANDASPETSE